MKKLWRRITLPLRVLKWAWQASGIGIKGREAGLDKESINILRKRWHDENPPPRV